MTNKEQVMIDGTKEECEILFECESVNELASYTMIQDNIKITPENAPTKYCNIRLIADPKSPYGFISIFKRNKNVDEWEYMGFGHSGACSVVTALLKKLKRKEQECEELKSESFTREELITLQEKDIDCYRKALDEIEEHFEYRCEQCREEYELYASCDVCWKKQILNIINKAKEGKF